MPKFLWTQKQDIGPRPRLGLSMAFDSNRQRTILVGGLAPLTGHFCDTWEWDGDSWSQITDLGPEARSNSAIAYDSHRRRTVLFGGFNSAGRVLGDTWEWDGENWTQVEDSGPAPRVNHALAFDLSRNRVVLFGGLVRSAHSSDTWEWDGEQWTQTGEGGPPARSGHVLAYDRARSRVILFGGANNEAFFGDTWSWNGEIWTQVADIGPEPCVQAALAACDDRLVLYGGQNSFDPDPRPVVFGNTWEWDGRRWVQRSDFGPGPRRGHSLAYDSARRQLVLFGGNSGPDTLDAAEIAPLTLGDTWEHAVEPSCPAGGGAGEAGVWELTITPDSIPNDAAISPPIRLTGLLTRPAGDPYYGSFILSSDAPGLITTIFALAENQYEVEFPIEFAYALEPGSYEVTVYSAEYAISGTSFTVLG